MPEEDLIFETEWDDTGLSVQLLPYFDDGQVKFTAKLNGHIVCRPTWYLKTEEGDKGELVKQSVLVYHTGINAATEQGRLQ